MLKNTRNVVCKSVYWLSLWPLFNSQERSDTCTKNGKNERSFLLGSCAVAKIFSALTPRPLCIVHAFPVVFQSWQLAAPELG